MATLDPTTWIDAVTTAPPTAYTASNAHTYPYDRSTKILVVEVRNNAQPITNPLDQAEVEISLYTDGDSAPNFYKRAYITTSTSAITRFLVPYSVKGIYVRQSEEANSQGAGATDPNPPYEYRVVYDNKTLV
jgi:hypothetical protein